MQENERPFFTSQMNLTEISEADCIDNHKRDKRKLGMSSYIKADSVKNKMYSQDLYLA